MSSDISEGNKNTASYWESEIERYENRFQSWTSKGEQIVKRYTGREDYRGRRSVLNLFWSNVKTQLPALFSRLPEVLAERRHKDSDPLSLLGSEVIERVANVQMEYNDFQEPINRAVLDLLLVGRGVVWATFSQDKLPERSVTVEVDGVGRRMFVDENGEEVDPRKVKTMLDGSYMVPASSENHMAGLEHVGFRDFAHSLFPSWEEVKKRGYVGRRVFMSREDGIERYGSKFGDISRGASGDDHVRKDRPDDVEVWEMWDAPTRKRYTLARGYEELLEVKDDPLGLVGFFPCPRPIYSTLDNDSLVPAPDYAQYEPLLVHANIIIKKILALTREIGVKGVFSGAGGRIGVLFESRDTFKMVSVNEPRTTEANGVRNLMDFMPITPIREAVQSLIQDLQHTMTRIYEITGISDIMRGASDPNETASAQKLKAGYGSQRLAERQGRVEVMVRDSLRNVIEMTVELYPKEALRELSGFDYMEQVKSYDPKQREQLWVAVSGLLSTDELRKYRIDVETRSTIEANPGVTQEEMIQYSTAIQNTMNGLMPLVQADNTFLPVAGELLLGIARRFRAGRSTEGALQNYIDVNNQKYEQQQQAAQQQQGQPPPDPAQQAEAQAAQAQAQKDMLDLQAKQQKMQSDALIQQAKVRVENARAVKEEAEAHIESLKLQAAQQGAF